MSGRGQRVVLGNALSGRVSRRSVVRVGAVAAGAVMVGGAPAAIAAGRPVRSAANPAVISVHANLGALSWPPSPIVKELIYTTMDPFLAKNPGLKVALFPADLYEGGAQASMIAGNGPDIFADYVLDGFTASQLALDLQPYVTRDNVNLNDFQQGQIRYIREVGLLAPGTPILLCALPSHAIDAAMAVNLGVLDEVGYKYPAPDWTYLDWQKMWEATTVKAAGGKKARYGLQLFSDFWVGYNHSYNMPGAWILHGWGGEFVDPNDPARCYLDSAGSIAAGEWMYNLLWSGVGGQWGLNFANGDMVSSFLDTDGLLGATTQYRGMKWDVFPFPIWPANVDSYTSTDSWGIWAGTKNPEAAWTVLKWLAVELDWIRLMMRISLMAPSQRSLTEEFLTMIRQVAPPLRDKNLNLWLDQTRANDEYVGTVFRYASAQAENEIGVVANQLQNKQVSVAEGFRTLAARINATESAGRAVSAQAAAFESRFRSEIAKASAAPATFKFSAPARNGAGVAPVTDSSQVVLKGGTWTVTGGGGGVNGVENGLTFACAPVTAATGTFTCRIVSIQAVSPKTSVNDGAKFGLMVRGDLSDDAASVGVEVAAGRGIHSHGQPFPGTSMGDQRPGAGAVMAGLLPAAAILADDSKPATNYLTKPVWLRLVRALDKWTAYSSLDGKNWTQAGVSMGCEILGGWIGLYVTAHGNGNLAKATFDNIQGFTPDTFVRVGAP